MKLSFFEQRLPKKTSPPTEWLSFDKYRRLFAYPLWNQLLDFIDYTRSYERGLDIAWVLLEVSDVYQNRLSQKEHGRNQTLIYTLILQMLDKLDLWEEYLSAFEQIHFNTRLSSGGYYAESSREHHIRNGAGPFLLDNVPGGFRLHLLYGLSHRKAVIERKLARKQAGHKLGNQYHATQAQLTEQELRRRIDWPMSIFQTVRH